jgi:23S rRNA pseudouridine1911/1915/1917 synthase
MTANRQSLGEQGVEHRVAPEEAGLRLDKILAGALQGSGLSRSRIVRWIREGRAEVDGEVCSVPSRRMECGEVVRIRPREEPELPEAVPGDLDVRWSDEHLLVLNKPAGLTVHPAPSLDEPTLVHRLLHHYPGLETGDPHRPGIVHRLDRDTSGLMLAALGERARERLARALSEREVEKEYLAVVLGRPEQDEGTIDLPLGRDPGSRTRMAVLPETGKKARTSYRVMHVFPDGLSSLLRIGIVTGRTHQIRVHMAHMGHPVLGDEVYGARSSPALDRAKPRLERLLRRQMLHSWRIGFFHPESGERMGFHQRVPMDFSRVLLYLQKKTQQVGITGSVGSGKSSLTRLVSGNKIPVWSADAAVAELYEPGADGWEMLRRSFGSRYLTEPGGPVDKTELFRAMQESDARRREILDLIHPLVEERLERFWERTRAAPAALAEVPLLVEAGWHAKGLFDVVIGVHCPREHRWRWLQEHRGWTPDQIERMESWQLPEEEKMRGCNLVVPNTGTYEQLRDAARRLREVLAWLRRRRLHRFRIWLSENAIV